MNKTDREAAWEKWMPEFDIPANLSAAKCGFYAGYAAGLEQIEAERKRIADEMSLIPHLCNQFSDCNLCNYIDTLTAEAEKEMV